VKSKEERRRLSVESNGVVNRSYVDKAGEQTDLDPS
jgi:hypothetical protein